MQLGDANLLNQLANKKVALKYTKENAPFCANFKYISISHSHNYCGVVTSNNNIGIDVQYKHVNMRNLSSRFMNKQEKKYAKSIQQLHFIWCAKEAIYKTLKGKPCSFKENLFIKSVDIHRQNTGLYQRNDELVEYNIDCNRHNNYFITTATIKK